MVTLSRACESAKSLKNRESWQAQELTRQSCTKPLTSLSGPELGRPARICAVPFGFRLLTKGRRGIAHRHQLHAQVFTSHPFLVHAARPTAELILRYGAVIMFASTAGLRRIPNCSSRWYGTL